MINHIQKEKADILIYVDSDSIYYLLASITKILINRYRLAKKLLNVEIK